MTLRFLLDPKFWLGVGIGLAVGVSIAKGLQFSKGDSARFLGALIGALIAVSGAISLHYLKINEERDDRRKHLRSMMSSTKRFAERAAIDVQTHDYPHIPPAIFAKEARRTQRYAENFQYDDLKISEALFVLEDIEIESLSFDQTTDEPTERKRLAGVLRRYAEFADAAILELDEKPKGKK